jgi:hypothetical protein
MSPMNKVAVRRRRDRSRALGRLRELSGGSSHYENYRARYLLWCTDNSEVKELRPLFRISGIAPDGQLSITEEFRKTVQKVASEILPEFADARPEDR